MKIYTIGYSGRTVAGMAEILERTNGALLDIRLSPRSRKPGFSEKRLREQLGERYEWIHEFGNINYKAGGIKIADPEVGVAIIDEITKESDSTLFLMCACKDPATCHRSTVAALLREQGYTVEEWQD